MTVQFEGGYSLLSDQLVRGLGPNSHTAQDLSMISDYAVNAVNHIQDTPWKVNKFILSVLTGFQGLGEDICNPEDTTQRIVVFKEPMNPKQDPDCAVFKLLPKEQWDSMSKEDKKDNQRKRSAMMRAYEAELGKYRATERLMNTAVEMSQFDHFYFPHNMDWRTRIYPIPTDLTPQSNDVAKGLLSFAKPTKLGEEGLYWLEVMVVTHWGEDKLHPDDRRLCRISTFDQIARWVDNPIENRGWLNADKPFQFLAAAHELVWAYRSKDPENFLSYLPGNLDGSCNGAQHLSILTRDYDGAHSTNCTSSLDRSDLYQDVAEMVWEWVQKDVEGSDEKKAALAKQWHPRLEKESARRKVVKRSVMTVPYGVTEFGIGDFMRKEHTEGMTDEWEAAKYMRDLVWRAIHKSLNRGTNLQRWFAACAETCAEAGVPMVWETPSGCKVTQAYYSLHSKRITCANTRFIVYEEDPSAATLNVNKMRSSASPNVIHSCDAAHLQITTCRMYEAGIRNFSMIHDSFGCPLAQMGLMRDILRQSIVDMYSNDYLQEWRESVEYYSGLTMPDPKEYGVEYGDFDIEEVLESDFFFA